MGHAAEDLNEDLVGEELVVRFLDRRAQHNSRPRWEEYAAYSTSGKLVCLCLWGEKGRMSDFRSRLKLLIRDGAARRAVAKIRRVIQRNGTIRFDLWVQPDQVATIREALCAGPRRMKYFVRQHIPYIHRVGYGISQAERLRRNPEIQHSQGNAPRSEVETPKAPLRLCTLNINSINRKREELRILLKLAKIDVLCLQETRQRAVHWPLTFGGYRTYVSLGYNGPSSRGLGILVPNKYQSELATRASTNWMFVKISG